MNNDSYAVQGFVRFADGYPVRGAKVTAVDRDLRSEQPLGQCETAQDGSYRIEYAPGSIRKKERGTADLVVKVFDPSGALLAASSIAFNAPAEAEIDLTVPLDRCSPPSLFEKIEISIAPVLGAIQPEGLEEDQEHQDLTFLSGETGFEREALARFALSHRLAKLGIQAELWFALLGGSFFTYAEAKSLTDNLATIMAALPSLDALAVRKALARSFNDREIREALREKSDAWVEELLRLLARRAVSGPSFEKRALEHAGIEDVAKQERFARIYNRARALTPEVMAELQKDTSFTPAEIADIRTSYELAELTRGDFSLVRALKDGADIRRPEQIRKLAKQSEREWHELLQRSRSAGDVTLPISFDGQPLPAQPPDAELTATTLERRFREAFPTTAFAGGLERALRNGGSHGLRHAEALRSFLDRHPDFELLRTPIDDYLGKRAGAEVRTLAMDEGFKRELKGVQRVFKLAPTFEATDTMLADGVHSAQVVYRMGESEFVRRYADRPGFSKESAKLTWNRAADTYGAVLTLVGDLKALDAESLPQVLKLEGNALAGFPNWNNLFQSGDLCDCKQCRSVLGPAAYFADLLMFLKDRKAKNPALSVKDILFARRPDLGYLELNCENANTTLPYVDVVCEVLERVIAAGESDVELVGLVSVPAGAAAAKAAVAAALSTAGIAVGADFSLSQVDPADPNRWVVHGDDATYLLKKKATPNFFAEILPNTKASSDELRAYPAYVDPKAYDKLREARAPFALPFDLFVEEVRVAFEKCNLQRWDLMRTLRGPAAPNAPTDGEIAAEYFDISSDASAPFDEKRLILDAAPTIAEQQEIWGEKGNAGWLGTVSNVKTFLQKTGLEYEDLFALLDLAFINPDGDILVQHTDASCDTDKKVLQGLTPEKLDRIHRFLRLWRKLDGWKAWELDLVLRHESIGAAGGAAALDEPFLIRLYSFGLLRSRLGAKATVEQAAALLGDLTTETHFVEQHHRRADALYQSLFLNKRLTLPLDPAFEVSAVDVPGPTTEKISGHRPVVLAALGVREADLDVFAGLTRASNGKPYITDDLTLGNLSFLWRHAWLAKSLKLKADDWKTVLELLQKDVLVFADPKAALDFIEEVDHLRASGFSPDELDWILTVNRSAKAAVKEADAARFITGLRTQLQAIHAENDPARYELLNPPSDEESLSGLLSSLLLRLNRDEPGARFFIDTLRDEVSVEQAAPGLPAAFDFPTAIKDAIRIRYDEPAATLRFTGLMTAAERTTLLNDPSLAAVTGILAYQQAIEELFRRPRLALKFLNPVFTAPLAGLPSAVDFKNLADPALAMKIAYDAEARLLRVVGVLSATDKAALDALSADPDYRNAVNSLFTQPALGAFPAEEIWLEDADLKFPLRDRNDPTKDNLKDNLAAAVIEALGYLERTLSEGAVVEQTSAQLGLTQGLTRRLLTHYAILPDTLLAHLTTTFAATTGVVDYATLPTTFDGWFWATRVASLWRSWKLTLAEWERIRDITTNAKLLDFGALPRKATDSAVPIDRFLRTSRLVRFKAALPETGITLLEVLQKLDGGDYAGAADFAADVQLANDVWSAADVLALTTSLDLAYPADYLLAESWERARRAFYFVESLNAGIDTVKTFAGAAMTDAHAKTLKGLLRSKLGDETWLVASAEIQDGLRERKRDALSAYLLAQAQPAKAPTGKWENTNDLYAYYLLDVEMCSCQLTSRLVQGSGSVQLLVQRCFMGLEPEVVVTADGVDGDSGWRWWKWMSKYRVWEANRKVFLWPENWIEPELRKDSSSFFKDLQNELLQNEIDAETVEKAFANYLEKLDGVAQLELAGFYQEDDADEAIVHVFGRTTAEPHVYYYRRYGYRQWTPWEKVDLDIQGDYLVPAVVNKRLFLLWPQFMEVPDEEGNKSVPTPNPGEPSVPVQPAKKRLQLKMAVSDYRQGKWTPKRVSTQYDESGWYTADIVRKHYSFFPVDRTAIDGRFGVRYGGYSADRNGDAQAILSGAFEVSGCKGVPELTWIPGHFQHALRPEHDSTGDVTTFLKWAELDSRHDYPENDLSFESPSMFEGSSLVRVLEETPWLFRVSPPWHMSYLDRLLDDAYQDPILGRGSDLGTPAGSWLPFFYNDKRRTFFVLPTLPSFRKGEATGTYYPSIKREFKKWDQFFEGQITTWVDSIPLGSLTPAQREAMEKWLSNHFPGETVPPFTDEQLRALMVRQHMRYIRYFLGQASLLLFQLRQFHFKNFYHPFVCDFAKLVNDPLQGIPGLMKRETQLKDTGFSFERVYRPTFWVLGKSHKELYPKEDVDFSPDGAYAPYNWELFFHAPLLIANALSRNQRFEEARDWYHFMFNPLGVESAVPGGSAMSKYWITRPFFEMSDDQYRKQRIENILNMLAGDPNAPGHAELEAQVLDWRTYPFEPHRIASYRRVAYQKTVVMKYLDNLIAWGDYLFRQDSMESINEATQLYILAAELLGPRPKKIAPQAKPPLESFNELEKQLDAFSSALVEVENLVPPDIGPGSGGEETAPLPMLYFCIPHNEKLLGYWDTVADRLYKIRHCMNIEGVVRQLALFEPPIDPGALVKAVAGGVDIGAALADLDAPLPLYRFGVLLRKANEVCDDVKNLGGALLAALEKKDADALGLLRQGQEIRLLEAVKAVREQQIAEAKENLESVKRGKELTEIKKRYYESREFMNAGETAGIALSTASTLMDAGIAIGYTLAGGLKLIPDFVLGGSGFGGSPHVVVDTGGQSFGSSAEDLVKTLEAIAKALEKAATLSNTIASYQRRKDDWDFQKDLAVKEIAQHERQIAAAELKIAIAEKELENHVLQIESAKAVDAFLRSKYTGEELYQWQVGQISGVFFQSYRLAYDLAKRAERCFRFELGLQDSSFIRFGYWDSLKKGLLSGEKLQHDLRRLESAYLEQHRRELELTKHVSLALLDPLALVKLRETGRCFLRLPEEIFDLDYPGHYFRRIKSVSLTLPCVTGPYTTISCTLRLLKSSVRVATGVGGGYAHATDEDGLPADDTRFVEGTVPVKAIATSSGQSDSGLFELSLGDERYLPFEGAGAISEWAIELFSDLPANNPDPTNPDFGRPLRQFDYGSITDVILHVKYTAREDAGVLKNAAITHLREHFAEDNATPSLMMLDLRRDFASAWSRFLKPTNVANGNVFELDVSAGLFPIRDAGKELKINSIWLLARCTDAGTYGVTLTPPLAVPPPTGSNTMSLVKSTQYGGLHFAQKNVSAVGVEIAPADPPVTWKIKVTRPGGGNLTQTATVEDLLLVLGYEWQ